MRIGDDVTLTPAQVAEVLGDPQPSQVAETTPLADACVPDVLLPAMTPPIFIWGGRGAGKSTFALLLAAQLWPQVSAPARETVLVREMSSIIDLALGRLFARAGLETPCADSTPAWAQYFKANKERFRPLRTEMGDLMRALKPAYLLQACLDAGARIVVGVRREEELVSWCEDLHSDHTWLGIHVARPGEDADNYDHELDAHAACTVANVAGLGVLDAEAERIARFVKHKLMR